MLVVLILGYSRQRHRRDVAQPAMLSVAAAGASSTIRLRFRLERELARRFPDAPTKGTTYYAVMRVAADAFMRLPKPQVKIGQQLPEHYR